MGNLILSASNLFLAYGEGRSLETAIGVFSALGVFALFCAAIIIVSVSMSRT